jgi:hypothetical protein
LRSGCPWRLLQPATSTGNKGVDKSTRHSIVAEHLAVRGTIPAATHVEVMVRSKEHAHSIREVAPRHAIKRSDEG